MAVVSTFSLQAEAHRVGLSRGEYEIGPGEVESRLTFAQNELAARVSGLDADADGELSPGELQSQSRSLEQAIVARLVVSVGGGACTGKLESATPVGPDGVVLVARHRCGPRAGELRLDLGFLEHLDHGHRHVAQVTRANHRSEQIAYKGNAELRLPGLSGPVEVSERAPAIEFMRLGVEHILTGIDHLLFLFGIILLPAPLMSILFAVTAFTLAHSLTLALSVFGVVSLSPAWVEPLIALSVAYVGIENLIIRDASRRWRLTFLFGLIHGLGFAGALREIGLPRGDLPLALGVFNVGVELGQVFALAALLPPLRWLGRKKQFVPWALRVASAGLILAGAFWFIERTWLEPTVEVAERGSAAPELSVPGEVAADRSAERSVYPPTPGGVSPLVDRVCRAFNELPRTRRAACEGTKPSVMLTSECRRMLGAAMASGAIATGESEVESCLSEWTRRYDGCDWITARVLQPIAACETLLHGNLEAGVTCRSSLECRAGLHCDGVGPMDAGQCAEPRATGAACGLATDPLMSYVQSSAPEHPECQGACVNNRCREALAER